MWTRDPDDGLVDTARYLGSASSPTARSAARAKRLEENAGALEVTLTADENSGVDAVGGTVSGN